MAPGAAIADLIESAFGGDRRALARLLTVVEESADGSGEALREAYQRAGGSDDALTYSEWRVLLGWETVPTPRPGFAITSGHKLGVELGYVFGREFEFESPAPNISLDDALLLRATFGY